MQTRSSGFPWWAAILVLLVVGAAGWWLFKPEIRSEAASQQPPVSNEANSTPPLASAPPATSEPAPEHHPIAQDAADAALPALADSDGPAWDALSKAVGDDDALKLLLRGHLIQRIVVMVDNLTQPSLTQTAIAINPVAGSLQIQESGAGMEIAPANAQRYAPYVQAFTHVDADALAGVYKRFYPLFQQAYAELGKPDAYFNDRLVQVIDHLLAAPEPTTPLVVEPDGKGRFRYTDPSLESLSVGQKALLRLGPEQESAVKTQLKAIRTALTQI